MSDLEESDNFMKVFHSLRPTTNSPEVFRKNWTTTSTNWLEYCTMKDLNLNDSTGFRTLQDR